MNEFDEFENKPTNSNFLILQPLFEKLSEIDDSILVKIHIPVDRNENKRLYHCLRRATIITYYDLKKYGINRTIRLRNAGKKTFEELVKIGIEALENVKLGNVSCSSVVEENILDKFSKFLDASSKLNDIQDSESKDYSLFQNKLREFIYQNAFNFLTTREYSIFKRRFSKEHKETLQQIGVDYNVTRERIRQISIKCLKKIQARMTAYSALEKYSFISDFYTTLMMLGKNDIFSYFSYSKYCDDLDWVVINRFLIKFKIDKSYIPKYTTPKQKAYIEKQNEMLESKKLQSTIIDEETGLFHYDLVIIRCVNQLNRKYGVSLISSVLYGADSQLIKDKNLNNIIYYSKLKCVMSRTGIRNRIYELIEMNYIAKTESFYPTLYILKKGSEFLDKHKNDD